ncbi:unnamed protein product [Rhizophagus irregularis]|jgi:hypothetical protein|nr:unnamed protein product [Rhizophagus irregularis]
MPSKFYYYLDLDSKPSTAMEVNNSTKSSAKQINNDSQEFLEFSNTPLHKLLPKKTKQEHKFDAKNSQAYRARKETKRKNKKNQTN